MTYRRKNVALFFRKIKIEKKEKKMAALGYIPLGCIAAEGKKTKK
tara:strand:- start:1485 stop:1619 length:135 start_codon:yes stop_codon:yes gene_type:complete